MRRIELGRTGAALAIVAAVALAACGDDSLTPLGTDSQVTDPQVANPTETESSVTSPTETDATETDPAETGPPSTLDCTAVLAVGCEGADVVELQQLLSAKGVADLVADGDFGPLTAGALEFFESACSSCVEDGMIEIGGPEWQALEFLSDDRPPTPDPGPDPAPDVCLDCPGIPDGGVSQQLGNFGGGGSGPNCDVYLEEALGLSLDDPYAGVWRGDAELGRHTWFCVLGFAPELPIDITMTFPDGSTRSITWTISDANQNASMDILDPSRSYDVSSAQEVIWPLVPGYPPGAYSVMAVQGELSVDTSFSLSPPKSSGIEASLPQWYYGEYGFSPTKRPGSALRFLVRSTAPNATVTPLLYRAFQDGTCEADYCFVTDLRSVTVDDRGVASFDLPTDPTDPLGGYCVTLAEAQSCSSEFGFSGEFFLGEPFSI